MEEGRMVEPERLAGVRVFRDHRADGARAQPLPRLPLNLYPALRTVLLDLRSVGGLEDRLPGEAEAVAEVADVHPALGLEALAHRGIDAGEHPPTVGDRRLAAGRGSLLAEE